MNECFHTTKLENLPKILKSALQPIDGSNTILTADTRAGHISYSVGIQGLVNTFSVFQRFYNNVVEGKINEVNFKNKLSSEDYHKHQESIKKIQQSTSYKDWIKDNIYLCFNGELLEEKNEEKIEDSYTTKPILSDQLKVCVIKSKTDKDLQLFSMVDIYSFLYAKHPELKRTLGLWRYEDEINRFKNDDYFLEYIDLSKFCEMHQDLFAPKENNTEISSSYIAKSFARITEVALEKENVEEILTDKNRSNDTIITK